MRLETAPTGLGTAKLTPMVRLGNRTYRLEIGQIPLIGYNTVYLQIFEIFEDIEMYYTAILNKSQH